MLNLSPLQYDNRAIRVQTDEFGEPWFNANDVCGALDLANPRDALTKHCDPMDVAKRDTPTAGGLQKQNYVNDSGIHALVFGSTKPEALKFKRWVTKEVLPSIRKTGQYAVPGAVQSTPVMALQLALTSAQMVSDILNLQGAARLGMVREAHVLAGASHLLTMVPSYAVDAPRDAGGNLLGSGSSEVTAALSTLLTAHRSSLSAVRANKLLQTLGLLEQRTRPSTRGDETRKYWAVSTAGLKFGKNITSPSNPREVQPHWYESTGAELVQKLEAASC
jgi:prophage antirepressor-like protein